MERTEDKNMDEEDEAGNSGEEDDIQIRLAAPAPLYFPNHFKNKEMYSLLWLWPITTTRTKDQNAGP